MLNIYMIVWTARRRHHGWARTPATEVREHRTGEDPQLPASHPQTHQAAVCCHSQWVQRFLIVFSLNAYKVIYKWTHKHFNIVDICHFAKSSILQQGTVFFSLRTKTQFCYTFHFTTLGISSWLLVSHQLHF